LGEGTETQKQKHNTEDGFSHGCLFEKSQQRYNYFEATGYSMIF
jgi:hypothetical protein